jgi:hypothetical protein
MIEHDLHGQMIGGGRGVTGVAQTPPTLNCFLRKLRLNGSMREGGRARLNGTFYCRAGFGIVRLRAADFDGRLVVSG